MGSESGDQRPEGGQDGAPPPSSKREPSTPDVSAGDDIRVRSSWRSWLSALATDAEAAMAAAFAYESLQSEARDAWLDVLEADVETLPVPTMALYAPLLAVECDASRRRRIEAAIASDPDASAIPAGEVRALRGVAGDGIHACVVVEPLYLAFVRVLSCRYTPAGGFVAVKHDPLRSEDDVEHVRELDGVAVEPTPLHVVVEELAHAILADKREHRITPAALASFAHLFVPQLSPGSDVELPSP